MTDQVYGFPSEAENPPKGHSGNTDATQDALVFQLQEMLKEAGYTKRLDRLTMLRFLRARKWDVKLAKDMFVNCEKWRKDTDLDNQALTFEYTEKPKVFEYYPQYYHKTDKDGRPIYIESLGKMDLNAMMKITTEDRMLLNLAVEYERLADHRLPACSRKANHLLETCCTIMDLKGVSLWNASSVYGYVKKVSGVSQDYYPERLGKLYVINAPWGFAGVFNVVKGFLDPVTVNKINVLGSGYEKELLKQVPVESLPKEFGGTCSCEGGCQLSDAGPWQEAQYQGPYFKDEAKEAAAPERNAESSTGDAKVGA